MKYILTILSFIISVTVASSQFLILDNNDCANVYVNDIDNTPYLDSLLTIYNLSLDDYELVDIFDYKDFTCVKTYTCFGNDDVFFMFKKPEDVYCYGIGYTKLSVIRIEYDDKECGVNSTIIFTMIQ